MRTYFVRVAADKQVVGLFVAPSVVMLAALVDECCDPTSCEYALAGMGGLMVERTTGATWPLSNCVDRQAGKYELASGLEQGALSQQWEDDLRLAPNQLTWKRLTSAVPSIRWAVARNNPIQSEDRSAPNEEA